jgi:conjugative transfer pilus assembly protein TraH
MKKLTITTVSILIMNTNTLAGGWMDDWVDQSTHSGPNYFQGQQRGYFTGGSYSARLKSKQEYLFSIQKPRLQAGCGGIDLFMGGFSFLDPEYLMQKFQGMIQAAPTVAFQLALKEMAPSIATTITEIEAIIDKLNGLQMDECKSAKELVGLLSNKYEAQGGMFSQVSSLFDSKSSAKSGSTKGYKASTEEQNSNNGKPVEDQKKSIEGCSAEFKNIFTTPGSLLNNIAKTKGLESYSGYMRAYIGDVIIKKSSGDKQYAFEPVSACPDADVNEIDDIITGESKIRPTGANSKCERAVDRGVMVSVSNQLTSIASKIKAKASLNSSELKFLNSIPFNVYTPLEFAVRNNNEYEYISNFKDTISRIMAYALVDDLVGRIRTLIQIARDNSNFADDGSSVEQCEPLIVAPLLDKIHDFKESAMELQKAARLAKREHIKEINNNITYNKNLSKKQ